MPTSAQNLAALRAELRRVEGRGNPGKRPNAQSLAALRAERRGEEGRVTKWVYGMGYRTTSGDEGTGASIRVRRVRISRDGYAPDGAYFGVGAPVFTAESDDGDVFITLRAGDAASAKAQVRKRYPGARVR